MTHYDSILFCGFHVLPFVTSDGKHVRMFLTDWDITQDEHFALWPLARFDHDDLRVAIANTMAALSPEPQAIKRDPIDMPSFANRLLAGIAAAQRIGA